MSDIHLMWYLATNEIVPMMKELSDVLVAIKEKKADVVEEWAARSPSWQTLQTLIK